MFGSSILEVAIGLVFVYLLLSLVCTTANELIAALTTWRAINLEQGIRNLLNDPSGNALAKVFYEHPLIKGLYRDEKRKPSYIPSRTFALTLMDIALPADHPRPKTMGEIRQALADTKTLSPVPHEKHRQAGSCGGLLTPLVSSSTLEIVSNARRKAPLVSSLSGTRLNS